MYYEQEDYHEWIKQEHNKKVYYQEESTLTDYQRRLLRKMRKNGYFLHDSFDSSRFLRTTEWKIKQYLGEDENGYSQYRTVQGIEQHTAQALQPFLYIRNILSGTSKRDNHWRTWWYQTTHPSLDNLKDKTDYGECPKCGDMCQPDAIDLRYSTDEYATCENCGIMWTIHHDDPTDKRDGTEAWRTYRISEIEDL